MVLTSIKKYDFIDALRGFAILGVVLAHTPEWIKPCSGILNIAQHGRFGVQLFYVVSALTLFLSKDFRKEHELFPLRNFFIRRFFRIAPLFYIMIAVYMFIDGFSPNYWAPNGIKWWYLLLTVFFFNGWSPQTITSVVPGGWSIAVEMTFYMMVPYLYFRLSNVRLSIVFVFSVLILSHILSLAIVYVLSPYYPESQQYLVNSFSYLWFFSQAPVFGMGIIAYHIFKRYQACNDRRFGLFLLFLSLFLFISIHSARTTKDLIPQHLLYGIAFCVFALSLHLYPTRLFVNPITRWIGKISFSIYLTHILIIRIMPDFITDNIIHIGNPGFIIAFVILLTFSVGVSSITYRIIETPGIRFGKYLIQNIEDSTTSFFSSGFHNGRKFRK